MINTKDRRCSSQEMGRGAKREGHPKSPGVPQHAVSWVGQKYRDVYFVTAL